MLMVSFPSALDSSCEGARTPAYRTAGGREKPTEAGNYPKRVKIEKPPIAQLVSRIRSYLHA